MVIENKNFLKELSFNEDTLDLEELNEDSVMSGMYYGPMGEA